MTLEQRARELLERLPLGAFGWVKDKMTITVMEALRDVQRQTLLAVASRLDNGTLTGTKHPQIAEAVRKMEIP